MSDSKITRRALLRRGATLGAGVVGLTVIGCGDDALRCNDTSGLEPAQQATRSSLGYVEQSPHGTQKNCSNCNFVQGGSATECAACTLVPGPVHPLGYCNSWAESSS